MNSVFHTLPKFAAEAPAPDQLPRPVEFMPIQSDGTPVNDATVALKHPVFHTLPKFAAETPAGQSFRPGTFMPIQRDGRSAKEAADAMERERARRHDQPALEQAAEEESHMTPLAAAQQILSIFVTTQGARPGRTFPVVLGNGFATFVGALQGAFLQSGAIGDLAAGLNYAVGQGWLSFGNLDFGVQTYTLEQSGFAEAGGAAPTLANSAQRILNLCVQTFGATALGALFEAEGFSASFVGVDGGNTFAPEDLLPGVYYGVAQGWLRTVRQFGSEATWYLTAAGFAQGSPA